MIHPRVLLTFAKPAILTKGMKLPQNTVAQDTSWIHQRQVEERSSLHKVGTMADVLDSVWDEIIFTPD
jgi:hypothetical protein